MYSAHSNDSVRRSESSSAKDSRTRMYHINRLNSLNRAKIGVCDSSTLLMPLLIVRAHMLARILIVEHGIPIHLNALFEIREENKDNITNNLKCNTSKSFFSSSAYTELGNKNWKYIVPSLNSGSSSEKKSIVEVEDATSKKDLKCFLFSFLSTTDVRIGADVTKWESLFSS